MTDLLLARAIERIIIVCAGMMSLYLGYRLFVIGVRGSSDLQASHKNTKIKLVKAAPGLFFALLGAVVLLWAITRPLEMKNGEVMYDRVQIQQQENVKATSVQSSDKPPSNNDRTEP